MNSKTLDRRVAVVTGASRGLGKAIAIALGSAGASLALVSWDVTALTVAANQVRELGAAVETFQAKSQTNNRCVE